ASIAIIKRKGDNGSPWRNPLSILNSFVEDPFTRTEAYAELRQPFIQTLITERILRLLPHLFNRLKHWKIQNFKYGDLDQLCGALSLLRNSSNLETLWVQPMEMGSKAIHVDMEPASNYLESPGCLGKALDGLKTIEIVSVEGSRPELLFIKILLDHSPSPEKMIIRPRTTDDPHKMLKISRNVMQFPRASTKAKMLCLDPKPPNDIFK
ncbi:hypothetical protein Tco_0632319, partial [Tanacetum coccineum]